MERSSIRHLIATNGYRASKAFSNAPETYADFQVSEGVRTPIELVNHMSRVLYMAVRSYKQETIDSFEIVDWKSEIARFYTVLRLLDQYVETYGIPENFTQEKLIQGPLVDVSTHVGQLLLLRRLAGSPVEHENFLKANIDPETCLYPPKDL